MDRSGMQNDVGVQSILIAVDATFHCMATVG